MKKTRCPVCEETLEIDGDLEIGDTIYCPSCDGEFKIISLSPPRIEECSKGYEDGDNYIGDNEELKF